MKLYPNVSIIFCIWVLAIVSIFYFGFSTLPHSGLYPDNFLKAFANWDGGHYVIISHGYWKIFQYAFFPLYPLLMHWVQYLSGNIYVAGILISVIASYFGVNLFYQLVEMEFDKHVARKALLALLFFPMSFYFLTIYTESLFFFLAVATFVFARKRYFLLATVTAALASATRLAGLTVVIALIANLYYTKNLTRKNWYVIFAPLGFLAYCYFLFDKTGNPFYFIKAESNWQRSVVFPGTAIVESLQKLFVPGYFAVNFRAFLDFIFAVFGIGLVIRVWRKLSLDLAIFSILSLALPLFSPTLLAMPRYLLTIFPIFIVLSQVRNQYLIFAYQIISILLLSGFAILFMTGNWVS